MTNDRGLNELLYRLFKIEWNDHLREIACFHGVFDPKNDLEIWTVAHCREDVLSRVSELAKPLMA